MNPESEEKIIEAINESWIKLNDLEKSDEQVEKEIIIEIMRLAIETQFKEPGERLPLMQAQINKLI